MKSKSQVSPRHLATRDRYDRATMFLHWSIAVLIVIVCITGLIIGSLDWRTDEYNRYYWWHRSMGELTFALALVSFWWRARREPPAPFEDAYWRASVARFVKGLITVLLVVVPLSKIARGAYGIGWEFFGWKIPALLAPYRPIERVLTETHVYSAYALMIAVGIHTAGALWHHVRLRDRVLERMLP